mmetsp:Transcript_39225/g.77117  ORF Transcript_39225/g.77117 Transcript_39225/m.77117 type:complete len:215 (-) Transcript_39225:235-879(-)
MMGIHPILLYIPNMVGYVRIFTMILSFYYCFDKPTYSFLLYGVSQGLDAVDGVAARYFNQTSRFGAVLDMLTDRMSTAVLLIVLSHLYKDYWGFYAFLVVLDIVAHWFQMYSSMACGKTSHKGGGNFLLQFYYSFPFLLISCAGNEMFLVGLYLRKQDSVMWVLNTPVTTQLTIEYAVLLFLCPIFMFKQFMNFVQLWDSVANLLHLDASEKNI